MDDEEIPTTPGMGKLPADPHDTAIVESVHDERITTDVRAEAEAALALLRQQYPTRADKQQQGIFDDDMVLHIIFGELEIQVEEIRDEFIIGRRDTVDHYAPELDLTSLGGYQMGLSRRHARIRRDDQHLLVTDLDSRNGTFINGQRLQPDRPQLLRDGDELQLGRMRLQLAFRRRGR